MSQLGGPLPQTNKEDEDRWRLGQIGTRGTELNEKINQAIINLYHQVPQEYRDAIRTGVEIGWQSGSTMPDGSPNPIQTQDLALLLNLSPQVLKYKAARSLLSR